jgi:hypothetical protein
MIFALAQREHPTVLPLYQATGGVFPLILAVIVNRQRGQVYVDKSASPTAAVVITNFGFMCYLGSDENEGFNAGLVNLLAQPEMIKPSYLLWYDPPAGWRAQLDLLTPEPVRCRERTRFEFHAEQADYINRPTPCPPPFALRRLDEDLLPQTEKLGIDITSRFWSSGADFLAHGLGIGVLKGSEIVSLCYAACVADGLAEDIVTAAEYRGAGLGALAAQQFVRECLRDDLTPTWDCFTSNIASYKLAERLGFVAVRSYPFYNFNLPLKALQT